MVTNRAGYRTTDRTDPHIERCQPFERRDKDIYYFYCNEDVAKQNNGVRHHLLIRNPRSGDLQKTFKTFRMHRRIVASTQRACASEVPG